MPTTQTRAAARAVSGARRAGPGRPAGPVPGRRPAPPAGLTGIGVVVLLTVLSAAGLLVDLAAGHGLGWLFGAVFVLGCGWVAARARPADDTAAMVSPPLVFAAAMVVADGVIGGSPGHFPVRQGLDLATSLAAGAPMLLLGSGLAVLVVRVRRWRARRP